MTLYVGNMWNNFDAFNDALNGMELMVFERCRGPYGSEMMESEGTGLTHGCQTPFSYPRCELDPVGVEPLTDAFTEKHDVTAAAGSPNVRSCKKKL